jgi:hypothetical protein
MSKQDFTIQYNGRRADCIQDGFIFMVQITYKPVYLELKTDGEGIDHWIETETRQESELARELGSLIRNQHLH